MKQCIWNLFFLLKMKKFKNTYKGNVTFLVASRSCVLCGISVYCCIRRYLCLVPNVFFKIPFSFTQNRKDYQLFFPSTIWYHDKYMYLVQGYKDEYD